MTSDKSAQDRVSRRALMGAGVVVAGGGVAAGVAGHVFKRHKRVVADGKARQIILAWPNPDTDPVLCAAQAKGIFASHNLDVKLVDSIVSGPQAIDALGDGRATVAAAPLLTWLMRIAPDTSDARLFCGARPCTFRLLVRKASHVPRVDLMKQRTVAVLQRDAADRLFFSIVLKRKGVDPKSEITWKYLSIDDVGAALADGSIDAIAGHDPTIWQVLEKNRPLVNGLFNSVDGLYGQRTNMTLAISNRVFQQDPVLTSVLSASIKDAGKWVGRNPDEAVSLLAAHSQVLAPATLRDMVKHQPPPMSLIGHELRVQVEQYIDEMKLLDLFPNVQNATDYAHKICVDPPTA